MPDFQRKRNRLEPESYQGRNAYFLTLCTDQRHTILAEKTLVDMVAAVLRTTCESFFFHVTAYCFMPDHLHLILIAGSDSASLPKFAQAFKSLAAREARKLGIARLWQKGFYDHVLRDGESLDAATLYVLMNPVRACLVRSIEEWAFSFAFAWPSVPVVSTAFIPPWKRAKRERERE